MLKKFTTSDRAEFVDLILGEMLSMAVETTAGAQPHNIFIYMTTLYVSLNAATTSYMLSSELPPPPPPPPPPANQPTPPPTHNPPNTKQNPHLPTLFFFL